MLSHVKDLTRDDYEAAGRWLVRTYESRGLNRSQLAKATRLSVSTLQSLEAGGRKNGDTWTLPNPSPANLYKLAAVLGVPAPEVGTWFGKDLDNITPPDPAQVTVESVAAEVRALRGELGSLRARIELLLDRLPLP